MVEAMRVRWELMILVFQDAMPSSNVNRMDSILRITLLNLEPSSYWKTSWDSKHFTPWLFKLEELSFHLPSSTFNLRKRNWKVISPRFLTLRRTLESNQRSSLVLRSMLKSITPHSRQPIPITKISLSTCSKRSTSK